MPEFLEVNGRDGVVAYARISPEDHERLSKFRWSFAGRGYVRTGSQSNYLHRMVLNTVEQVDHINGDKLDNRRENLRPASNAQNHQAFGKIRAQSGYRGVSPSGSRWRARVNAFGVEYAQAGFETAQAAAAWRDAKAVEVHGEFYVAAVLDRTRHTTRELS